MSAPIEIVKDGLPELLPRLWRFGLLLCRSSDHASDLVQMTCLRAMERADQFEPGTRLDRWCFSIMASIWKNEMRSRSVRLGNGQVDAQFALTLDAREHIENDIFVQQVLDVVQTLPELQRVSCLLVYVEGYSYSEAARLLDVPIGTLMSRLAAAKSALAQHFGTSPLHGRRATGPRR